MSPIEIEIFNHLFQSIAEEMGAALMRAAFSPNIKERRDHSCALFDAQGALLAQAAHIPVHLGSMPLSVQAAISQVPMSPGVSVLLNDPYAGGTHLPDLTLVTPVFLEGQPGPAFFVANRAHHADVGGIAAGSLPLSRSIDEEGFRIGPTPLSEAVVEALCRASRTPDERRGDLAAQTAANRLGAERLAELAARHGVAALRERAAGLLDYSARLMEEAIEQIPAGVYAARDWLDDDGFGHRDLELAVRLRVSGRRCQVDFSESAGQTEGPVNTVRAVALSAVFYVFRCLAEETLPTNAGCLRPIEVVTRPGSLLDARPPAPVAGGNVETSQRIVDVLLRALAQALPDRIPAASAGSMSNVAMGGGPAGDAFVYYETIAGGAGAGPGWDGESGIHTHMTNTLNTPVEALEHAYPLRVTAYHLRPESGGPGRFRGGDGVVREYAFRLPTQVTTLCDRHRRGPWGLQGGEAGAPGRLVRIEAGGAETELPSKGTYTLEPGQRLRVETPGGGAFGEPSDGA